MKLEKKFCTSCKLIMAGGGSHGIHWIQNKACWQL